MSYSRSFKQLSRAKKLGVLLIGSVLAWALGLPAFINTASAASLTSISDTLISSATSTATNHTIVWTSSNTVTAAQNIKVTLSADNSGTSDEFTLPSFATATDVTLSGSSDGAITVRANAGACAGGVDVYNSLNNNIANNRFVQLTVCPGDTVAAQTLTLSFVNNHVVNPANTGSYVIRVNSGSDSADTRVAIIQTVTMNAIVDTSLTFTISGVATNTALLGGQVTGTTTTATNIDFGHLVVGNSRVAAQLLTVNTNAQNGYQVTVVANQALTSNTGADIDFFIDGAHTAAPTAWQSPANTLGNENTYGHFGLTSDDTTLTGGDPFSGGTLYVGNFASVDGARQVMRHTAPVNGQTIGIGTTTVSYRIQIASLQEAGNDYSNVLTYVCTPTF